MKKTITQGEVNAITTKFEQIIENKKNELEEQKQNAKKENIEILYYSLENAIYNLSLIDGYLLLSKNYRYNASDTLIRTIYETLFQNIFMYTKIKSKNKDDIDELKKVLSKTNELIKFSNRRNLLFLEIWKIHKDLEYENNKKVSNFIHNMRKKVRKFIKNKDPALPSFDFIEYDFFLENFDEKSDVAVHNTLFINSMNEGKRFEKMDRKMIKDTSFFLLLDLCLIRDILQIYNKDLEFEEETFLRKILFIY